MVEHITYGQLEERAKALAQKLQLLTSHGDTVLLLYPSGLEYISAFLGLSLCWCHCCSGISSTVFTH